MTLRVTRQYVDVLGRGDGKARVTRQYIDVLGDASIYGAATDSLVLSQTADAFVVHAGGQEFLQSVADTILFSDAAECQKAIEVSVSQELSISDAIGLVKEKHVSVIQSLGIVDSIDVRGPIYLAVVHRLQFEEPFTEHLSTINVAVEDRLAFSDRVGRVIHVSVSDTLALNHAGIKVNGVNSTLSLAQTILVGKGRQVVSTLALTDEISLKGVYFRGLTDGLNLRHSSTYELVGPTCIARQYQPFVGFSTDTEIGLPDVSPPSLAASTLTLTYPFALPTLTVVLRNPEFANKDSLGFNRVNRQTRGGTLIVYADQNWPKSQKLYIEVRCLKASQASDLVEFLTQSLGKEIGLLDHEHRQWRGIITNPDTAIANPEQGDYTASIEFEGQPC